MIEGMSGAVFNALKNKDKNLTFADKMRQRKLGIMGMLGMKDFSSPMTTDLKNVVTEEKK